MGRHVWLQVLLLFSGPLSRHCPHTHMEEQEGLADKYKLLQWEIAFWDFPFSEAGTWHVIYMNGLKKMLEVRIETLEWLCQSKQANDSSCMAPSMWRRFLYNLCNTCHLWICDSWYCHVLSIIHFVSAFSLLHRIQGHTAYHLFLKGKTKTDKCHKNAIHTCQIQFSVLKFLLITAVMSPFGPSQSCNTLHHPKGWDKNPFQHGVFTGLSAAPETEAK